MIPINTEYKPPRPSSARAAKARRVELTIRRLLVKLANRNLCDNAIKIIHSLTNMLLKTPTSGLPPWHTHQRWHHSRWLTWPVSDYSVSQTTLLAHHITTITLSRARWELHTRQNIAGPGHTPECEMSGERESGHWSPWPPGGLIREHNMTITKEEAPTKCSDQFESLCVTMIGVKSKSKSSS